MFDVETQLYYLQSRYYDPAVGRFLSADTFVSTGQGFTGNNMFAYCGNNPVNMSDPTGEFGILALCVIGGIAGGLIDYAGQVISNYRNGKAGSSAWTNVNWGSVAASTFSGVISAIPGTGIVATAVDVIGSAAIEQGVNCAISYFDNDPSTDPSWDNKTFLEDVGSNVLSEVTLRSLKIGDNIPQYIRDIKDEARAAGIKGTKKLQKYLNFRQVTNIIKNSFYSDTMARIY